MAEIHSWSSQLYWITYINRTLPQVFKYVMENDAVKTRRVGSSDQSVSELVKLWVVVPFGNDAFLEALESDFVEQVEI